MFKQISDNEAADILLAYYQIIDGDRQAEDYLQHVEAVTQAVLEKFSNRTIEDDNAVVSLFLISQSLDSSMNALDNMGAEETARLVETAFLKTDANLRAVVSNVTGVSVLKDEIPEYDFVVQYSSDNRKVVYLKFQNSKPKRKT